MGLGVGLEAPVSFLLLWWLGLFWFFIIIIIFNVFFFLFLPVSGVFSATWEPNLSQSLE